MSLDKDPEVAAHAVLKQRYKAVGCAYKLIRAWYDENGALCIEAEVAPRRATNFIDIQLKVIEHES